MPYYFISNNSPMLKNVVNSLKDLSNPKQWIVFLALLLSTAGTALGQTANNAYIFYNATYGYLINNGGNPGVSTTFNKNAIWVASGTLPNNGNTSRNIYSYLDINNNTKSTYLTRSGTSLGFANAASTYWRTSNNSLRYRLGNNSNYFLKYTGSAFDLNSQQDNGDRFTVTGITITEHNSTPSTPTISITATGLSNGGIQLVGNVTGSYIPTYYSASVRNQTYYWTTTTDATTTQPTGITDWSDATKTWAVTTGGAYASVSNDGLVTITGNPTGNVVVTLSVSKDGYTGTQTFTLTRAAAAQATNTVVTINSLSVSPSSAALYVSESQAFTASATVNSTTYTTPAHTTLTNGGNIYRYYNGTLYTNTEDFSSSNSTTATPTYAWSISGAGSGNASLSTTSGASTTVTHTPGADADKGLTLTVEASYTGATPQTRSVQVNLYAPFVAPTITRSGNNISLSTASLGATIYYTTDGSTPSASNGTAYTGPFSLEELSLPVTVKAIAVRNAESTSVAQQTYNTLATEKPVISISSAGAVTITCATAGASIRYTTDGTDPTSSTGTVYAGSFNVANLATVKAIAYKDGYAESEVVSETYITSGVSGTMVILNDLEDHSWSYYSDASTPAELHSLSPADVKITYYGNGIMMKNGNDYTANTSSDDYITSSSSDYKGTVKVNVTTGENQNTFIYYKTLERGANTDATWTFSSGTANQSSAASRCPYTTIPNPFQVRPTYGSTWDGENTDSWTGWRGFQCWRLKSVSGGAVYSAASGGTALAVGAVINAETQIYFAPNSEYGMDVQLEAVWAIAYVVKANGGDANAIQTRNVGYERNFIVLHSTNSSFNFGGTSGKRITNINYSATVSTYYPDGTQGANAGSTLRGAGGNNLTLEADTKFENIQFNIATNYNLTAANHDIIVGRGCTGTVNSLRGMGGASSDELNYMIRLESGRYDGFAFIGDGNWTMSDKVLVKAILGCDYDRATTTNNLLRVASEGTNASMFYSTGGVDFSNINNKDNKTFDCVIKSGTFQASVTNNGAYNHSIYCGHNSASNANNQRHYPGARYITIEGGEMASVNGGRATVSAVDDENVTYTPGVVAFYARVKGGTIRGSVFGGAADNSSGGTRKIVITGGEIRGWVAAGSNGTNSGSMKEGRTHGNGIVYVGGRAVIGGPNATAVNGTNGGQVFGAGRGTLATDYNTYLSGTFPQPASVYNSYVVIADEAQIYNNSNNASYPAGGNVYGGGNYGTPIVSSNVYILGGTVQRNVYGGAYGNYETIPESNVIVKGGTIGGSVYGGSNQGGKVEETNVSISGGTVSGSAFGAGLGTQTTQGSYTYDNQVDNTSVTVSGGNVNTDVYGGGEEGRTNGNTAVTVSGGTVGQDVYGGGALANVGTNSSNTTTVTITGGTVQRNVYGGGLGSNSVSALVNGTVAVSVYGGRVVENVFGCNNIKGAPQNTVTVDIYGTDPAPDANHYALGAVYGGGNLADYSYGTPTVTVHNCDNSIGYVYGGGNAAHITNGNTDVTIYGGNKIGTVFGGGNGAVTAANVSGSTNVKIYGGTILQVFGGSNTNGTIGGSLNVNVNKQTEAGHSSCDMIVGEVYGGGNVAASNVGNITIGCTGTLTNDHSANPENIGVTLEGVGSVYGGANQANITGNITLDINDGIVANVFGGNNTSGTISGTIAVNINKTGSCNWYVGNVFGGGNQAAYSGSPVVTVTNGMVSQNVYGGGNEAGVNGSTVNINGGGVGEGVYGGCNTSGTVDGDIVVNINGGTLGTTGLGNAIGIFGGGFGASTATTGNVTVTIGDEEGTKIPVIYGDIYGGSALGDVNSDANDLTKIDFLNGTLHGNIYGGGLGDASNAAKVKGEVRVNISSESQDLADCHIDLRDADIYGCNNTNGSPQADVTVHIWKTGFTTGDYSSQTGSLYAIDEVFGGGNKADYLPENGNANSTKKATVYIHDCLNSIWRVFGGGNKAAATGIVTTIDGGRFDFVFGGGNGEVDAANVGLGGTNLTVHSGIINHLFGGSNTKGVISGPMQVSVDNSGISGCDEDIHEFFGGGNLAVLGDAEHPITLNTTIACNTVFGDVYGGSNLADIYGNITLTINGGSINNVYAGSKGVASGDATYPDGKAANIHGNVKLNIYGGDIGRAYGGSNINGNITGTIGVDLDWSQSNCSQKEIDYIYGASNDASYTPDNSTAINPTVKLINGTVGVNVYGGGRGATATVTANPKVIVGDASNASNKATVNGDVFGGGDAANVNGSTNVIVGHTSTVMGNVFGGGNAAAIKKVNGDYGNTLVILKDKARVYKNVYGGGNQGVIEGDTKVVVNSATE